MTWSRLSTVLFTGVTAVLLTLPGRVVAGSETRGILARVDLEKKEIEVTGRGTERGKTLTFKLYGATFVKFGLEKGTTEELVVGQSVRIEYDVESDGKRVARVIRVLGRRVTPEKPGPTPPPTKGTSDGMTGVLQRVARTDREIVVIGPGSKGAETETTLAVPETAKVFKEGKPSSLEALHEGDTVTIRTDEHSSKPTALEVQVGAGAVPSSAMPAQERSRMVPRIRQALHLADEVLKHLDTDEPPSSGPKKP